MHNSKLLSIPLFIPVFIMVMSAVPSMAADLQSYLPEDWKSISITAIAAFLGSAASYFIQQWHQQRVKRKEREFALDAKLIDDIVSFCDSNINFWRDFDITGTYKLAHSQKLTDILFEFKGNNHAFHIKEMEECRSDLLTAIDAFMNYLMLHTYPLDGYVDVMGVWREHEIEGNPIKFAQYKLDCEELQTLRNEFVAAYDKLVQCAKKKALC